MNNYRNDTYMVAKADGIPFTIEGTATTAKGGDLLIPPGIEGSNGYIAAADIEWNLVPSGVEPA